MPDPITIINLEPPIIITIENAPGPPGPPGEFTVSATTPVSPSAGDAWYNSDNGRSYIYYYDGNTTQWVEFGNANIGGSFGTYTAYTPTFSNFTLGDGTVTAKYCAVNDFVHVTGSIVLGSTSAVTGNFGIGMNFNADAIYYTPTIWVAELGTATFFDTSATTMFYGIVAGANNSTIMQLFSQDATTTSLRRGLVNATTPFTWATGDEIKWNCYFKKA